jgi:hypothetical protein
VTNESNTEAGHPVLDTSKPSIARTYDAFLNGKDNFEVDREVVRQVTQVFPEACLIAMENRQWLVRAVRFLTREPGIDQFLDVGSGLPTAENTHEVAQLVIPDATVVYVDNDPACQAFGRALLEGNGFTHFVDADLTRPRELLAHPSITRHLDFDRPLAMLQCGTLHHVPSEQRPHEILSAYIDALPSGSYVLLTHFWDPKDNGPLTAAARDIEQRFRDAGLGSGFWRPREEIEAFFDGLEMVEPGLVPLHEWWPDGPRLCGPTPADQLILGGVARKP